MKWLKACLVMTCIGAFALATNHCRLEVLRGLEFLICCSHEGEAATPHQDDDCQTDGCATLEEGFYKSEDERVFSTLPVPAMFARVDPPATLSPGMFCAGSNAAPPEFASPWQFRMRAAASPRAPSIAS